MTNIIKWLLVLVAASLLAVGGVSAAELAKPRQKECGADENGCNARPEAPRTRGLKTTKQKECAEENSCAGRPEAPRTRGLKATKQKESCAEENTCN